MTDRGARGRDASSGRRIAIIGGGASGALAACAIGGSPADVSVFETRDEIGRGYAYSTTRPEHLLNVPASRLSVDPADPDDISSWGRRVGLAVDATTFLRRCDFGSYLADRSATCTAHVRARVVDVDLRSDRRLDVQTADGRRRSFDDVILATGYGHAPGARLFAAVEDPRVIRDPYAGSAFDAVGPTGTIVVVGTGLTAVDAILTLTDERPHQHVIAVSRRGRTPSYHDLDVTPVHPPTPAATTARQLVRTTRLAAAEITARGGDWRSVIDGLRQDLPQIWRALPDVERARLLRHARRPWDLHRHRLAPAVATRLADLIADGRVSIRRGRPTAVTATPRRLTVALTMDGTSTNIDAAGLVLCTGIIDDDWRTVFDPLLARLVGRRLITPDPVGIGPLVDQRGRFLGASGAPTPHLWAIGPLRRASEWEATAIPEIRRHAAELAKEITRAEA